MKNMYLTNATCPRCGKQLKTSDVENFAFFCERCGELVAVNEVKQIWDEDNLLEISIEMSEEKYQKCEPELMALTDKYKCAFLGHDDVFGYTDFGWEEKFSDDKIVNRFVNELETIIDEETRQLKEQILKGLNNGTIKIANRCEELGCIGLCCIIGEYAFYFCGDAFSWTETEYWEKYTKEETADMILYCLLNGEACGLCEEEMEYYKTILKEETERK